MTALPRSGPMTADELISMPDDGELHELVVYRTNGSAERCGADGVLSGEDVVPGFMLNLAAVWEEADEAEDRETGKA